MSRFPEPPSAVEIEQIRRALDGCELTSLTLKVEVGSPWLQIDAWIWLEGERKLALWRATGAIYTVGSDGAVEDDPFLPAAWKMETL